LTRLGICLACKLWEVECKGSDRTRKCIYGHMVCNGADDCGNNSDEQECGQLSYILNDSFVNLPLSINMYLSQFLRLIWQSVSLFDWS